MASFTRPAPRHAVRGIVAAAMLAATSLASPVRADDPAKVAAPVTAPLTVKPLRSIPKAHCNYLFDRLMVEAKARGKGFISKTAMRGMIAFYAFDKNELPTCTGPREIAWERDSDFDFIMALGWSATDGFKQVVDFNKDYGFKPARRPTVVGPAADLRDGAKPTL